MQLGNDPPLCGWVVAEAKRGIRSELAVKQCLDSKIGRWMKGWMDRIYYIYSPYCLRKSVTCWTNQCVEECSLAFPWFGWPNLVLWYLPTRPWGTQCRKPIDGQLTKMDCGLVCGACSREIEREIQACQQLAGMRWPMSNRSSWDSIQVTLLE